MFGDEIVDEIYMDDVVFAFLSIYLSTIFFFIFTVSNLINFFFCELEKKNYNKLRKIIYIFIEKIINRLK